MAIFKAISCWVYILGSIAMLVSASPIATSSTALIANTSIPLISTYNPEFVNIEKRQKKFHPWWGCNRENVGQHNCPLMLEACLQYYHQFPKGDSRRASKLSCKSTLCFQTKGDCFPWSMCNWCS